METIRPFDGSATDFTRENDSETDVDIMTGNVSEDWIEARRVDGSGGDGLSQNMRMLLSEVYSNEVSLESDGDGDDQNEDEYTAETFPSPQRAPKKISLKTMIKIKMGYNRLKREVISDTTELTLNHLLKFVPFDRKISQVIIRKGAILHTLQKLGHRVSKSGSLQTLLSKLLNVMDYNIHYSKFIRRIEIFQKRFRDFLKVISRRTQGPGFPVTRCVNEECPFTLEKLVDIPAVNVMTWRDGKIYGCDGEMLAKAIRDSISYRYYSSVENLGPDDDVIGTINPFTRQPLKAELIKRCVKFCEYRNLDALFRTSASSSHPRQARRVVSSGPWTYESSVRPGTGDLVTTGYPQIRLPSITAPQPGTSDQDDLDDLLDSDDEIGGTFSRNRRIIGRGRRFIRHSAAAVSTQSIPVLPISVTTPTPQEPTQDVSGDEAFSRQVSNLLVFTGEQMTETEEAISESLRSLDFYTPINIMSIPLGRIREIIRHINDKTISMENLREFIQYIRAHMIPLMREASTIFSIPSLHGHFLRAIRGEIVDTSIFSQIRRGLFINRIHSHLERAITLDYTGDEMTEIHLQGILPVITDLVDFWKRFIEVFKAYFVYGSHLNGETENLPIEERRSLAISLISILFHGRFLGTEFEWASML